MCAYPLIFVSLKYQYKVVRTFNWIKLGASATSTISFKSFCIKNNIFLHEVAVYPYQKPFYSEQKQIDLYREPQVREFTEIIEAELRQLKKKKKTIKSIKIVKLKSIFLGFFSFVFIASTLFLTLRELEPPCQGRQ